MNLKLDSRLMKLNLRFIKSGLRFVKPDLMNYKSSFMNLNFDLRCIKLRFIFRKGRKRLKNKGGAMN